MPINCKQSLIIILSFLKRITSTRTSTSMISNKKQTHTEMSSLSTLGHSTEHSQATKKAISTQQISVQSQTSNLERLTSHHNIIVPFEINIKSLIKHLLLKLEEKGIIILHTDQKQGEILIQKHPHKNCWTSLLDCLCLCKKEGWNKGSITQSFEAVSIYIKRQYIEYRCSVKIRTNCPRQKSSPNLLRFVEEILEFIKKCIQSFRDSQEDHQILQINQESPLAMEIAANQKAYELFISQGKEDKRYKTLYNTALNKIKYEISLFKGENQINNENKKSQKEQKNSKETQQKQKQNKLEKRASIGGQKGKKMRVSQITQMIIGESNGLFEFCSQLKIVSAPAFHPDYALYSIQNLFCYSLLPQLFNLYKHDMVKSCEQFYKNAEHINKHLSSKQYFDYLEIRPKYRLQSSFEPYDLAINALRELQTSLTLREILLCVQKTFSLIKVCCLYEHDGKLDITAMDDILPVMIYVVARAQVIDFPVYVRIIDDYIKIRGVFELEERVVTTLYVATEDISKKIPKPNKE